MGDAIIHATAVAVAIDADGPLLGALLFGRPGAGKTTLALSLIEACPWRRTALAADDAVLLSAESARLVAACPRAAAPLIEIRGFGPARIRAVRMTRVAAGFDLDAEPARIPDPEIRSLAGVPVPVWPFRRGGGDAERIRVILRAILANEWPPGERPPDGAKETS